MSLLSVAQAVAEEVGLQAPASVVGSSDKTAKQLLRLINRAGKRLAKRNWGILQKEYTFTTSASTASYALPSDYDRLLDITAWDRTSYWSLRGPMTPWEWQVRKSGLVATVTSRSAYRIKPDTRVNKFFLDPTPTASIDMVFEYASDQWVKDSGNTVGQSSYAADTDIALISEELIELDVIWRLLDRKGFAYEEAKQEAEDAILLAFANDARAPVLNLGASSAIPSSRMNIPEGNFGL